MFHNLYLEDFYDTIRTIFDYIIVECALASVFYALKKNGLFLIYIGIVLLGYSWMVVTRSISGLERWNIVWAFEHLSSGRQNLVLVAMLACAAVLGVWFLLKLYLSASSRWARCVSLGAAMLLIGATTWYFRVGRSLGDSHIFMEMLGTERIFRMSQPLTTVVYWLAYHIVGTWGWAARNAVALVCSLAAMIAVWVWGLLIARLPKQEAWAISALVLPCSLGVLFCGYVETTVLSLLCMLIFILLSHRYLHGQAALWQPALALGIAAAFHGLAFYMVPSLALIAWARATGWRKLLLSRQTFAALLAFIVPVALTVGLALTFRPWIRGTLVGDSLGGWNRRAFVSLRPPLYPPEERYTMFSLAHFGDVTGIMLLVSPFSLLALIAGSVWGKQSIKTWWGRFLLLNALCGLAFVFSWNADLGMKQDWDLFGPPLLSLLLLGGHLLAGRISRPLWGVIAVIALVNTMLFCASFEPRRVWSPLIQALPVPPVEQRTDLVWPGHFELIGLDGQYEQAAPGETIAYLLYFRGLDLMKIGYTPFFHLIDEQGKLIAQDDHQPHPPTEYWASGEIVTNTFALSIPPDITIPIKARLYVGAYFWQTPEERLPLFKDGQPVQDNAAVLAEITIQ